MTELLVLHILEKELLILIPQPTFFSSVSVFIQFCGLLYPVTIFLSCLVNLLLITIPPFVVFNFLISWNWICNFVMKMDRQSKPISWYLYVKQVQQLFLIIANPQVLTHWNTPEKIWARWIIKLTKLKCLECKCFLLSVN